MVKAERMGIVAIQATYEGGLERVLRVQIARITDYWWGEFSRTLPVFNL